MSEVQLPKKVNHLSSPLFNEIGRRSGPEEPFDRPICQCVLCEQPTDPFSLCRRIQGTMRLAGLDLGRLSRRPLVVQTSEVSGEIQIVHSLVVKPLNKVHTPLKDIMTLIGEINGTEV